MNIIFLTRKYPPSTGGMETFSYELAQHYQGPHKVVARGHRQMDIIWAAPLLLLRGWQLRKGALLYHLGDLVLAPIAPLLRRLTGKPVVATVHGLELTYARFGGLYKKLIDRALPSIDAFVCVSNHTAKMLVSRGVAKSKVTVIPHGVNGPTAINRDEARAAALALLQLPHDSTRPILFTVGRLVRRKGVLWFVNEVLPKLKKLNPVYVVASDGPEKKAILNAAKAHGVESHLRLLGTVPKEQLDTLYAGSDVFVMPNIPVKAHAEGFGFVAIEAAVAGLPVIAADLEGIPDAIHQDKNGVLIPPKNATLFAETIREWLEHPEKRHAFGDRARAYTQRHFRWNDVAAQYLQVFSTIVIHR